MTSMSKLSKKDFSKIPTKTLKAILDENYTRGVNGAEYADHRVELEKVLWEREQRQDEKLTNQHLREMEMRDAT